MTNTITLVGTVADIFAHRFTLKTESGTVLADLGPKGAEAVTLAAGDCLTLTDERKLSEIKVHSLTRGSETIAISQGEKPGGNGHNHAPGRRTSPQAEAFRAPGPRRRSPSPQGPRRARRHAASPEARRGRRLEMGRCA